MHLKVFGWSLTKCPGCRALAKGRQVADKKEISLDHDHKPLTHSLTPCSCSHSHLLIHTQRSELITYPSQNLRGQDYYEPRVWGSGAKWLAQGHTAPLGLQPKSVGLQTHTLCPVPLTILHMREGTSLTSHTSSPGAAPPPLQGAGYPHFPGARAGFLEPPLLTFTFQLLNCPDRGLSICILYRSQGLCNMFDLWHFA